MYSMSDNLELLTGTSAAVRVADFQPYRDYFGGLAPWQHEIFNGYMDTNAPSTIRGLQRVGDWATHYAMAPDNQLDSLFEWNRAYTIGLNEVPSNMGAIATARNEYVEKIETAVAAGGLPEQALEAIPKVPQVPVAIGTVFDVEMKGCKAYYSPTKHEIVLGQVSGLGCFDHEMGHAVLGRFPNPLLDEAVNHHMTLGLRNGDFTTVNPFQRTYDDKVYTWKRYLGTQMMESGVKPVEPSLYIGSSVENDVRGPATAKMYHQTVDAFPGIDIWGFTYDRAATHAQVVHERFPEVSGSDKWEMGDMYAALSVRALGGIKRNVSIGIIREHFYDCADGFKTQLIKAQDNAIPSISTRGLTQIAMSEFTARKFAQDFEQGTSFLA